jgi:hypothetical protein
MACGYLVVSCRAEGEVPEAMMVGEDADTKAKQFAKDLANDLLNDADEEYPLGNICVRIYKCDDVKGREEGYYRVYPEAEKELCSTAGERM